MSAIWRETGAAQGRPDPKQGPPRRSAYPALARGVSLPHCRNAREGKREAPRGSLISDVDQLACPSGCAHFSTSEKTGHQRRNARASMRWLRPEPAQVLAHPVHGKAEVEFSVPMVCRGLICSFALTLSMTSSTCSFSPAFAKGTAWTACTQPACRYGDHLGTGDPVATAEGAKSHGHRRAAEGGGSPPHITVSTFFRHGLSDGEGIHTEGPAPERALQFARYIGRGVCGPQR